MLYDDISVTMTQRGFEISYQGKSCEVFPESSRLKGLSKKDVLDLVISDAECFLYCPDVYEFLDNFGWETSGRIQEGREEYEACKKTCDALLDVFSAHDLDTILDNLLTIKREGVKDKELQVPIDQMEDDYALEG